MLLNPADKASLEGPAVHFFYPGRVVTQPFLNDRLTNTSDRTVTDQNILDILTSDEDKGNTTDNQTDVEISLDEDENDYGETEELRQSALHRKRREDYARALHSEYSKGSQEYHCRVKGAKGGGQQGEEEGVQVSVSVIYLRLASLE
nr:hypothetical protein BaRGS_004855 [Batillaria attramentaria]